MTKQPHRPGGSPAGTGGQFDSVDRPTVDIELDVRERAGSRSGGQFRINGRGPQDAVIWDGPTTPQDAAVWTKPPTPQDADLFDITHEPGELVFSDPDDPGGMPYYSGQPRNHTLEPGTYEGTWLSKDWARGGLDPAPVVIVIKADGRVLVDPAD